MKNSLLLFVLPLLLLSCGADSRQTDTVEVADKIKGFTYTGPARGPIPPDMISSIMELNGTYIALIPEGTLYRQNLRIAYDRNGGWFGESMEATIKGAELAQKNGLSIMIKPHIAVGYDRTGFDLDWPENRDSASRAAYREKYRQYINDQPDKLKSDDSWRGSAMVTNESDWETLAENYTDFIMDYARLADSLDAEMFCVGTELKAMALAKPKYWRELGYFGGHCATYFGHVVPLVSGVIVPFLAHSS